MSKLWGGRFSKKTDPLVEEFTSSIHCDHHLAQYDLMGTACHVLLLELGGYLTKKEAKKLRTAISGLEKTIINETFKPDLTCEDIHTNIQNLLQKKVGSLVLKLQTARSRNEQVAVATKLFCKIELSPYLDKFISDLIAAIDKLSKKNAHILVPGFTHLQHAQPVYLKDHFLAYAAMLKRDKNRLKTICDAIEITLGSGALAGTPIDSAIYAKLTKRLNGQWHVRLPDAEVNVPLNFKVTQNALDAVSDRDFIIEILSALSILAMHLSRIAEDLIIWSTNEFDFVEVDDAFCTGSSLMPQKKNPDVLELIRGFSGEFYGHLMNALTVMKGLPLSYNRDMQHDKTSLFRSYFIISGELEVLAELFKSLKFNESKIRNHLKDESLYATDLVYYLVDKGLAFKEAHTTIGKLVKYSIDNAIEIKNMSEDKIKQFSNKFVKKEIAKLFDPKVSVESKKSIKRT